MRIIEPLENEPATTRAAAADDSAESAESEFAPWDDDSASDEGKN